MPSTWLVLFFSSFAAMLGGAAMRPRSRPTCGQNQNPCCPPYDARECTPGGWSAHGHVHEIAVSTAGVAMTSQRQMSFATSCQSRGRHIVAIGARTEMKLRSAEASGDCPLGSPSVTAGRKSPPSLSGPCALHAEDECPTKHQRASTWAHCLLHAADDVGG